LLAERGASPVWFRHPFLHTGTSLATKHEFEAFLGEHGYRVAPVTIDNADYIFARAYDLALDVADTLVADSIARSYIVYMDTVTGYYEAQARAIVGYELPQVLLLRQNRLNAHRLDDLIAMLLRRGYGLASSGSFAGWRRFGSLAFSPVSTRATSCLFQRPTRSRTVVSVPSTGQVAKT
jgi:hypothetical protein